MNNIVVDTDSFTGVLKDAFFGWVYTSGITFDVAFLSGKEVSSKNTEAFADALLKTCPKVEIYRYLASARKNHADVLCGVAIGRIVERCAMINATQEISVFILSCDKLVTSLAKVSSQQGLKTFVVSVSSGMMTIMQNQKIVASVLVNSAPQKSIRERILPEWATRKLNVHEKQIGLACEKVPTEAFFRRPSFIPFPTDSAEIDIGSNGGEIDLYAWDLPKKGLLPKNVTIKYHRHPKSYWTIRSNKGLRRSAGKSIIVNGKLIGASSSEVQINEGTKIDLGGFSFIFRADAIESFLRFESDVEIAKQIELHLKRCAIQIPWPLVEREHIWVYDIKTGGKLDLAQDFHNATYDTYLTIIQRFWGWFTAIGKRFRDFQSFHDAFKFKIKEGRNLSDHASSGGPPEGMKRKMIEFLFILKEEAQDWDVTHISEKAKNSKVSGLMQAFEQAFGEQSWKSH